MNDDIWARIHATAQPVQKPLSTSQAVRLKDAEREEIMAAVALFQAKGGTITHLPSGSSKDGQLGKMRSGELELINSTEICKRWKVKPNGLPLVMAKWPSMLYILVDGQKSYWLEDIKRVEQEPYFKCAKSLN